MGDLPGLITIQHLCYLVSALPFVAYNLFSSHELSGNQALDFLLRKAVFPTFVEVTFLPFVRLRLFLSFIILRL